MFVFFFFFFSSRRRHTRWNCDWSSDVCSSDLFARYAASTTGEETLASQDKSSTQVLRRENLTVGVSFSRNRLELIRPIMLDGSSIGLTVLQADLGELTARLQ